MTHPRAPNLLPRACKPSAAAEHFGSRGQGTGLHIYLPSSSWRGLGGQRGGHQQWLRDNFETSTPVMGMF